MLDPSREKDSMDRRGVLRILAVGGIVLVSLGRKALGQVAPALNNNTTRTGGAALRAQDFGLPSDWRFVEPRRWSAVDASLPTRLRSASRRRSYAKLGGIRVGQASGEIETGSLDPVGQAVELPVSVAGIVALANDVLSLEVLNRDFNPFLSEPHGADGQPLVGSFQAAGELYQGKTLLPVRFVVSELVQTMSLPSEVMQPLVDALSELVLIRTPAHQFRLGQTLGNRIIFYGESSINGEAVSIGHDHIDKLTHELAKQNLRLIKQMVHFDAVAQGGTPKDIVKDGVGGSSHAGGFSAGFDEHGAPIAIKSDWPSHYGALGDNYETFNAHLVAIDYSAGTQDPIPEAALKAYYRNADMWDCCAAILVPFADGDPDDKFRKYTYNPLEVYDQQSARDVAAALATLDPKHFLDRHGAFYCAEGQYVVANLGPQEDKSGGTLLKQSRYGDTPFGQLIANFLKAPAYKGMSAEERHRRPYIGWKHLLELGPDNGGISEAQAAILLKTDRHGIALDWIPEDVKGWQAYRPKDKEALIAKPMTVATMAWALLRLYMPRDRVAKAIAADIRRAYATGGEAVKAAVVRLSGGHNPISAAGQARLAAVAAKAATGLLLGLLASKEVRESILNQSGYLEITNETDKQRVLAAYKEFLDVLQNADYSTQNALDQALAEADMKLGNLTVTRAFYNRAIGQRMPAKSTLMKYAAPAAFGMWAQQPFLAGTGCLRYVATAMHVSQDKRLAM